jgi:hypothetical protein
MATQTTVIPLSSLQRPAIQGHNQAPISSNTVIQAQQRPSASVSTSASPPIQLTQATLRTASPVPTPFTRSQRWWRATTKHCSSTRVGVLIALIALGVGGYYYYGQYKISWKSWEISIWKDCRDRVVSQALSFTVDNISKGYQDIINSSICNRYANVSYDQIASRDVKSNSTAPPLNVSLTFNQIKSSADHLPSVSLGRASRCLIFLVDYLLLAGWLATIGALIFHVLVFISDMTSGHNFPVRAYFAVFIFINTSIATITSPSEIIQAICIATSVGLAIMYGATVKDAWQACLRARHDPSRELQWERKSLWGLVCDPFVHFLLPVFSIILAGHSGMVALPPELLQHTLDFIFPTSSISLAIFFAILSIGQHFILQTKNSVDFDYEAQSDSVIRVSHKSIFLERLQSTSGRLLKRTPPPFEEKKDQ